MTSSVITGLTNGTTYTFRVAAVNSVGTGSYSSTTTATPAGNVPGQPTALSASASGTTASLSWTAPASNGGSAITSYRVQSSTDGATWTTLSPTFPTATTASVASLSNATTYYFRVAAINTNGVGDYSGSVNVTISAGVPGAPTITNIIRDTTYISFDQLKVYVTAPTNIGGSSLTYYNFQTKTGTGAWTQFGFTWAPDFSYFQAINVDKSTSGTVSVRVAASNSAGYGPYSDPYGPV